ncbi:leucine-rich repeat and guanylate kinase domain-containing protein-like [Antedon mediterranea]|uniref:leucine-rich repeat and guanylate kinase domain-containing protein-like n=1 Tax=Antedon mediterranea TaxID=105859 RepID=UPI003AF77675
MADTVVELSMKSELSYSNLNPSFHETNVLSFGNEYCEDSKSSLTDQSYEEGQRKRAVPFGHSTGSDDDDVVELSPNGILDVETIAFGLSNLGCSSDGAQLVYLHLTLPGYNLVDISKLETFVNVQKVEIPYNKISDLSVLSQMPYLIELDASHNEITTMLDFEPPHNLQEVDLSYNQIEEMENLSSHHALTKLVIDNNQINRIDGLSSCVRLSHLSLAHNNISKLENLNGLSLKYLNLRGNQLTVIENIERLKWLQNINFSGNQISSLKGLEGHELLEVIDLEDNNIPYISEIKFIEDLNLLRVLNLMRNPIQSIADYRLSLLFKLPQVTELDRRRAEADEKVAAINLFSPPADIIAAHDHRKCMVYSFLKPAKILASTLPTKDQPYPMLIIVGPVGSGKRELSQKLVEEFPEYFGYGVPHSTRAPQNGELESCDYKFVTMDQFTKNIKQGNFVLTYQESGHSFGLTIDSIESVAQEGLACVTHMELEGVLSMKLTYFEPRYVLLLPLDKEAHRKRLVERGGFSNLQIESVMHTNSLYQDMHDGKPGFFDITIDSTNLKDAYRQLRKLLLEYLGISNDFSEDFDSDSYIQEISDGSATTSETSNSRTQSRAQSGTKPGSTQNPESGMRTWSRNTSDGTHKLSPSVQSKMESSKSAVEKASYERRKSAAQATAACGSVPSPVEQLNRLPKSFPKDMDTNGLTKSDTLSQDYTKPGSPDSSEDDAGSVSNLSNLSEARGFSAEPSPLGSRASLHSDGTDHARSGSASYSPLNLIDHLTQNASPVPNGSRPGSGRSGYEDSRPHSGRPGSEKKPVLPPITDKSQPEY